MRYKMVYVRVSLTLGPVNLGRNATIYYVVDTQNQSPEALAVDGVIEPDLLARYEGAIVGRFATQADANAFAAQKNGA